MDLAAPGRFDNLQSSFKVAAQCLLTACSREDVNKVFPSFTDAEKERLYRMLTRVMKNMHTSIMDAFDEICQEMEVAAALEKIDDFVEEQNLDTLSSKMTTVEDIKEKISRAKQDEIEHLTGLLKKVEESNNTMKARIELLKKGEDVSEEGKGEDLTAARDVLKQLRQSNSALPNMASKDNFV